jgi:hypothetical protein
MGQQRHGDHLHARVRIKARMVDSSGWKGMER